MVGDVADEVHRDPLPLERLEVARERRPVRVDATPPSTTGQAVPGPLAAGLTGDVQRHTLADLALGGSVS